MVPPIVYGKFKRYFANDHCCSSRGIPPFHSGGTWAYSVFHLNIQYRSCLLVDMKPYPIELRQRIVAAVTEQNNTIAKVADLFRVTERYVYQLLKLQRDTGDLAPRPHGGGAVAKLDETRLRHLSDLVSRKPDATLEELRQSVNARRRVSVSISTLWRGLRRIDITLKKNETRLGSPSGSTDGVHRKTKDIAQRTNLVHRPNKGNGDPIHPPDPLHGWLHVRVRRAPPVIRQSLPDSRPCLPQRQPRCSITRIHSNPFHHPKIRHTPQDPL